VSKAKTKGSARNSSRTRYNRLSGDVLVPASYFQWSAWPGRILAAIMLVGSIPVILGLMALVRLTSPGAALYRQKRLGLQGVAFDLYKIRTMRADAESQTGAVWCSTNDHRVTLVGRILRALHLDELPQLWNVVRGDMTLVGPRPERPEIVRRLVREIPGYMERHQVRPGITGLAQVNLPPDTDLDSVRRKLILDLEYIETANANLDLRIIACTGLKLFAFHTKGVKRFLKLYRIPHLPQPGAPLFDETPEELSTAI
jgi:lipopolysaccharide/colanic/teichoic acid biosynthesis glycosyltransferase